MHISAAHTKVCIRYMALAGSDLALARGLGRQAVFARGGGRGRAVPRVPAAGVQVASPADPCTAVFEADSLAHHAREQIVQGTDLVRGQAVEQGGQ